MIGIQMYRYKSEDITYVLRALRCVYVPHVSCGVHLTAHITFMSGSVRTSMSRSIAQKNLGFRCQFTRLVLLRWNRKSFDISS